MSTITFAFITTNTLETIFTGLVAALVTLALPKLKLHDSQEKLALFGLVVAGTYAASYAAVALHPKLVANFTNPLSNYSVATTLGEAIGAGLGAVLAHQLVGTADKKGAIIAASLAMSGLTLGHLTSKGIYLNIQAQAFAPVKVPPTTGPIVVGGNQVKN